MISVGRDDDMASRIALNGRRSHDIFPVLPSSRSKTLDVVPRSSVREGELVGRDANYRAVRLVEGMHAEGECALPCASRIRQAVSAPEEGARVLGQGVEVDVVDAVEGYGSEDLDVK